MPEAAVLEAPVAEKKRQQPIEGREQNQPPESRGILRRIRLGRKEGRHPDTVFAEIKTTEDHGDHKNTPRRRVLSPRGVEEADEGQRTEGLSTEEFTRLSFDLDGFLSAHPPVEGSSENEQHWARQQEAMMTCRTLIEQYIEQDMEDSDPTDFRGKLKGLVDQFDSHYQFGGKQLDITKDLIDTYYSQRQRGIELRAMYPDDRELVRAVTGVEVTRKNKVSVKPGPWGLEIIADNKLTSHILYRGETPPTDFVAGGLADVSAIPPYIVLNEGRHNDQTRDHERQHIRYVMNKAVVSRHDGDIFGYEEDAGFSPLDAEGNLLMHRRIALDSAKDEIFAYTFNAPQFPIEYFVAQDNNPYDYLHSQREFARRTGDPRYRETAQRILITEYNQMLTSAAATVERLRTEGGYSNREVIALLSDKPVDHWDRTARKLLEAKGISVPEPEAVSVPQASAQAPIERRRDRIFPRREEEPGIIDVVIRPEDKLPDWYEERLMMGIRKKPQEEQQPGTSDEQQPAVDLSFLMLNKMIFDITRSQVDFYNKIYGEEGLERYFSVLDKVTEETGKVIGGKAPTETQLEQAKLRLFLELEKSFAQRQEHNT